MKELWISNINSSDAKSLADEWESYLKTVGCEIYIQAIYDRMIITWKTTTQYTITHILSFIDDTFEDMVDIRELNRTLKNLKDDHAIIIDFDNGDVEEAYI
jgi:hypothetical protein